MPEQPSERLAALLERVAYELNMVVATDSLTRSTQPETAEHYAALESHLLHVRNLLEFFYVGQSDVLRARDYAPRWKPPSGRRLFGESSSTLYGDLCEHLAHIPITQSTKRGWETGRFARALALIAASWANALDKGARSVLLNGLDPHLWRSLARSDPG